LFAAWIDGGFVLLHHFMKKTRKTPRKEIERAKRELRDFQDRFALEQEIMGARMEMSGKFISPRGCNWEDFRREVFTPEEIASSDFRVAIIGELIKARKEQGISQKKLEEMSGVRQPVIARMEKGSTTPQIGTVMKVLASLGKKLAVVPIDQEKSA
jgi:ribosome-binding protein aMBF1 (putative translation factor)